VQDAFFTDWKSIRTVRTQLNASSRIQPHILWGGSRGFNRCGKIALMERPHLVRLERSDDGVKQATIVEQDKVLFLPVVRIDQLGAEDCRVIKRQDGRSKGIS